MKVNKKQLLINLSENDYNMLEELSKDSKMSKSEFIKTIIQLIGVTHKIAESDRIPENIQIGGYGITFPMEVMQPFYDNLASAFEKTDWKIIENSIEVIETGRQYDPIKNRRKSVAKALKKH